MPRRSYDVTVRQNLQSTGVREKTYNVQANTRRSAERRVGNHLKRDGEDPKDGWYIVKATYVPVSQ